MKIQYGTGPTAFGSVFIALNENQILKISFSKNQKEALQSLRDDFPGEDLKEKNSAWVQAQWKKINSFSRSDLKKQIRALAQGTEFQKNVWLSLVEIPFGKTASYSDIAKKIGLPKAVRAVGSAVGANPFGYLIPCHRVLPKAGGLGGFAWGVDLKKLMLDYEQN